MKDYTVIYKTPEELFAIRKAGKLAALALKFACDSVVPGISTLELDQLTEKWIRDNNAIPTFKGYMGFPATLCVAVNHEVVHGIPSKDKILKDGDIISIDVGVTVTEQIDNQPVNFIGDNARTVAVGNISSKLANLIRDTNLGLHAGIEQCKPGKKISDIARAIEQVSLKLAYGSVREFGGHGIGPEYHCAPFIPNFTEYFLTVPDTTIQSGMALAIEPMFTLGLSDIRRLKDGWTIITKDNKPACHCEHSVLVTDDEPEILTILNQ